MIAWKRRPFTSYAHFFFLGILLNASEAKPTRESFCSVFRASTWTRLGLGFATYASFASWCYYITPGCFCSHWPRFFFKYLFFSLLAVRLPGWHWLTYAVGCKLGNCLKRFWRMCRHASVHKDASDGHQRKDIKEKLKRVFWKEKKIQNSKYK